MGRTRHTRAYNKEPEIQDENYSIFETIIRNLLHIDSNEKWANLSTFEWFAYVGVLIYALVMPFLFSRVTTENFLTPKEFFSKIIIPFIACVLFCGYLFKYMLGPSEGSLKVPHTPVTKPLFAFFVFAAVSLLYSANVSSGIRDMREVVSILLLFPMIIQLFRSRWQVELLLWIFVLAGVCTSVLGILETYNLYFCFDGSGFKFARDEILKGNYDPSAFYIPLFPQLANASYNMGSVVSTFGNRNYLGTFAMFTAFIPLAFFFRFKNLAMKLFSLSLFGVLLSGLYVTRCRTAMVALAAGLVLMGLLVIINDRKFKLVKKNFILFCVVVGLIFISLLWLSVVTLEGVNSEENMLGKLKKTFTLDRSISNTYERMWVWHVNNLVFNSTAGSKLMGQGFGSFKHFFPMAEGKYLSEDNKETFTPVTFRQAHNDWIQVLSEMGIIGMALLLWLLTVFFSSVQSCIRRTVFEPEDGALEYGHILLIALTAAMTSQLLAAIPDFPFHRIETAAYAVIILGIIEVLTETDLFAKDIKVFSFRPGSLLALILIIIFVSGTMTNFVHEKKSWEADCLARNVEMCLKSGRASIEMVRNMVDQSIMLDPLPGDIYLKKADICEHFARSTQNDPILKDKYVTEAFTALNQAWKNINFNARSTYHSILYRKLHIYYGSLGNLEKAAETALEALNLTAGDARSVYYLYLGKIYLDILPSVEEDKQKQLIAEAENYLLKAGKYKSSIIQSNAYLSMLYATDKNWQKAYERSSAVCAALKNTDRLSLSIAGASLVRLGRYEEAIGYLRQALFLKSDLNIELDLAIAYEKSGRTTEALAQYQKIINDSSAAESLKEICRKQIIGLQNKDK